MTRLSDLWPSSSDWTQKLTSYFNGPSFEELSIFLASEFDTQTIFPAPENIFRAFQLTSFADTKVVIIGQDPYHGPGQAHGLSFSVAGETKYPPSLRNIYKELASDLNCAPPATGDLTAWARQGVLLLNTVLTVRANQANSHRQQGWETFTDAVIEALNDHPQSVVFILWGKPAAKKAQIIDARHQKICAPHPSPLSAYRGFFGSRPFTTTNATLKEFNRSAVHWC